MPVASPRREAAAERRTSRREALALAALLAVAAAVRFIGIGTQSLWLDEVVTAELVAFSFGDMMSTIPNSESTPYLYYVLLWGWADVVGHGEAALRSLSAVFGVATVAAIWAGARTLVSERAGLAAGALAALNPFLVWYSQEARAYALLVLTCAVSFWLFARALERRDGRSLTWWALASALALATHYFAAFTIVPEAIALAVLVGRTRAWAVACGAIGLAAVALAPLAAEQRRGGGADWIGDISLGHRIAEIPKRFVAGDFGNQLGVVFWPVLVIALAALALLLLRGAGDERRGGVIALVIGTTGLVVPIVFALGTLDYVFPRNLIGSLPPLLVGFAAGLTATHARRAGLVLLTAVLALSAFALVRTATDEELQRDDWPLAVADLNEHRAGAIVVSRANDLRALRYYDDNPLFDLVPPGVGTNEIAVIDLTREPIERRIAPRPVPGFTVAQVRDTDSYRLVILRSPTQMVVGPDLARRAALRPEDAALVADLSH